MPPRPHNNPPNPPAQQEPTNGDEGDAGGLIDGNMTREQLIEVTMRLQLENNTNKRQLTDVTKERDQLLEGQRRKRRRAPRKDNPTPNDHKYELAGKRCALFWLLWVSADLYDVELDENFQEATRYDDNDASKQTQGERWDMLQSVPETLRPGFVEEEHFQKLFGMALGEQRRTTASRVRACGSRIFGVCQEELADVTKRSSNAEFQRLLGFNAEAGDQPSQQYPRLAPVLYKDENTNNPAGAFRSSYIKKVFRAILFGPGSIGTDGPVNPAGNQVLGQVLGAKTTTIGAIAMAAVLTRWVISADPQFKKRGPTTSILWEIDYQQYKRLLHKALQAEATVFRRRGVIGPYTGLIDEWNSEFFHLTREDEPELRQGDVLDEGAHGDIDIALAEIQDFVDANAT
ncbi:unnamed protein product [Rhizoctonia solani]|uniref:Uncharacterized protein n=1 Tax=Rhizoctonia solani TaxID=456999 RepID=A0A8H2XK81_9AGAM|nr:unnamed protein product [Rhizoctonia solani]